MHIALLKDVVGSILGPAGVPIVDLLYDKKNVNEFLIAKKLKLTINQTRNMLYRLSDEGLVSFIRKKDAKKGGWYTYFWTLSLEKSLIKFKEKITKEMNELEGSIHTKKTVRFFVCATCANEMSEEQALLHDYHCTECGELMQPKDPSAEIAVTQEKVGKLREILAKVDGELSGVLQVEEKKKFRKIKAEQKKKQVERALRRKEREKEKIKLLRGKKSGSKRSAVPKRKK
jgi:transcription factor E